MAKKKEVVDDRKSFTVLIASKVERPQITFDGMWSPGEIRRMVPKIIRSLKQHKHDLRKAEEAVQSEEV